MLIYSRFCRRNGFRHLGIAILVSSIVLTDGFYPSCLHGKSQLWPPKLIRSTFDCCIALKHASNGYCRHPFPNGLASRKQRTRAGPSMWLHPPTIEDLPSDDLEGKTFFPPVERLVAIGDVHGDVQALRSCLKLAGLVSEADEWSGGKTNLVQATTCILHSLPITLS
jgi:hypothetical protein